MNNDWMHKYRHVLHPRSSSHEETAKPAPTVEEPKPTVKKPLNRAATKRKKPAAHRKPDYRRII